ncbi:MAG: hypothetical protein H0W58_09080 [Acidobacteria bacterium]|nr:hypothetical protein [Acidobacteriota bacterium]
MNWLGASVFRNGVWNLYRVSRSTQTTKTIDELREVKFLGSLSDVVAFGKSNRF